ncbi:hypothetical protein ACN24K_09865 [Streptomyces microflavus]
MIKAYGLTKRYGDRTVVQDLDFTVRPGTVTPGTGGAAAASDPRITALTDREREILTVIGQGWSNWGARGKVL